MKEQEITVETLIEDLQAIITQDTDLADTVIFVDDVSPFNPASTIWIEDATNRKINSVNDIGGTDGSLMLAKPVGANFGIGAKVIRPFVQVFDPRVSGTTYTSGKDSRGTILLAASIQYSLKIERQVSKLKDAVGAKGFRAANSLIEEQPSDVIRLAFKMLPRRSANGLGKRIEVLLANVPASQRDDMRATLLAAKQSG